MPTKINPIRKALVKKSLLRGNSIRQALSDGGYAPGTQRGKNSTAMPVVKVCMEEILSDLKVSQITPQWLLDEWRKAKKMAENQGDCSSLNAILVSIAKFVAQIADRHDIVFTAEEQTEINRIRGLLRVDITPMIAVKEPAESMQPDILQQVNADKV